ncbi:MAG: hypothetical protein AB7H80_09835 [Candidatus Kapaibacterium sp.]
MEKLDRIEFREIRNVAEVLNVTLDFIRQNFRLFSQSLILIALPPILIALTIFSYFFIGFIGDALNNAVDENNIWDYLLSLLGVSAIAGVAVAIGTTFLICVVHVFAQLYVERGQGEFTFADVWGGTKEIFWRIFITNIGLAIVLVILQVLAAFVPFGAFGLYILYAFGALYFPLRIYEGRGFFKSFTVSTELVQKRWWATLGLLSLQSLLSTVLSGLLFLPIMVVSILSGLGVIDVEELVQDSSWFIYAGTALGALYISVVFLLSAAPVLSLIFHYYNQKERKGGIGLLERIEMIGTDAGV